MEHKPIPLKVTKKTIKKTTTTTPVGKKEYTKFRTQVRSRHPSHDAIRGTLGMYPKRVIVRFGSSTPTLGNPIEINSIKACQTSANKLAMKKAFLEHNVKTAEWFVLNGKEFVSNDNKVSLLQLPYPMVAKSHFGSRGNGNYLIESAEDMEVFFKDMKDKTGSNYIFEKYYNYDKEYRLHVTKDGVFYTNRKMLKKDTPEDQRWYKNDNNCVWILEENPLFDKPTCWNKIVEESVKALKAVGLDFGAVDVRVQKNTTGKTKIKNREVVDFIIIEINSAPSFGEGTLKKYQQELPKLIKSKFND